VSRNAGDRRSLEPTRLGGPLIAAKLSKTAAESLNKETAFC